MDRNADPQFPPLEQIRRFGFSWDSCTGFGDGYMNWWSFYQQVVQAAPANSTIVEVGCYHGQSLTCLGLFAREANKGLRIIGVDDNTMGANEVLSENIERAGLDDTIRFISKPSVDAAREFDDGSCWLVFIDGGHLHDIVEADVRAWMSKVAAGGWLAGHDFMMYTVHQPILNLFPTTTIFDPRWDDVWIVPKQDLPGPVDIRAVPDKYPDRTTWKP